MKFGDAKPGWICPDWSPNRPDWSAGCSNWSAGAPARPWRSASLAAALIALSTFIPSTCFAEESLLQAQSPKVDETVTEAKSSAVHKLQVSRDIVQDQAAESNQAMMQEVPENSNSSRAHVSPWSGNVRLSAYPSQMFAVRDLRRMHKLYAERDTGYGVCGVMLTVRRNTFACLKDAYPTMPAAMAGLTGGDIILSVNGQSTRNIPSSEVWDWFTGMPGTPVHLVVRRGDRLFDVRMPRMDIGHIPDLDTRAQFLDLFKEKGMSRFIPQTAMH